MLKTIVRNVISKDYWSYCSWYNDKFGVLGTVFAFFSLCFNGIGRAPNPLTGRPVLLRPGTADQDVYNEIFLSKEYEIDLGMPRFIVDAGAHIGLSSVYFACRYPMATVIAIEPETSNFEVLLKNASLYPNIKPVKAGLWSKKTHLAIENSSVDTWSFKVVESLTGEGIPAVCIGDVIAEFGVDRIDVLKIDIEGSEIEVLESSQPWIDRFDTIIIELHDRFRPGCTKALNNALLDFEYNQSSSGESVVIRNVRRRTIV